MANSHGVADMAYELQTTIGDLLPSCVVSTTPPAVPGSGLVLAAFGTKAYVRAGQQLTYVDQSAVTVTLTGGDGTYWLAITDDTFSAFSGWTRRAGSHYMWRLSATRPSDLDNLLVFSQLTVSGGNITAVVSAPGVTQAEALRTLSGLGTLATQPASAVAITGGSVTGLSYLGVSGDVLVANRMGVGTPVHASYSLALGFGAHITGNAQISGQVGIQTTATFNTGLRLAYTKASQYGLHLFATDIDAAGQPAVMFTNVAGGGIGSITTTASATAYNTSSDGRLKEAIAPLADALATVQALQPVQFRWKVDGTPGQGFIAQDAQAHVPQAVVGDPAGPGPNMQMDLSKLVPHLVGAVQELAQQVEALSTRLAAAGA